MLTLLCAVQGNVDQLNHKKTQHALAAPAFCCKNIVTKLLQKRKIQKENDDGTKNFLGASDADIDNQIIEGSKQSSQLHIRMQVIVYCKLDTVIIV